MAEFRSGHLVSTLVVLSFAIIHCFESATAEPSLRRKRNLITIHDSSTGLKHAYEKTAEENDDGSWGIAKQTTLKQSADGSGSSDSHTEMFAEDLRSLEELFNDFSMSVPAMSHIMSYPETGSGGGTGSGIESNTPLPTPFFSPTMNPANRIPTLETATQAPTEGIPTTEPPTMMGPGSQPTLATMPPVAPTVSLAPTAGEPIPVETTIFPTTAPFAETIPTAKPSNVVVSPDPTSSPSVASFPSTPPAASITSVPTFLTTVSFPGSGSPGAFTNSPTHAMAATASPTVESIFTRLPSTGTGATVSPTVMESSTSSPTTRIGNSMTMSPTSAQTGMPTFITNQPSGAESTSSPTVGVGTTIIPTAPEILTAKPSTAASVIVTASPTLQGGGPATVCQALNRTDAIFFTLYDLTDPNILDNPMTPQGEAFRWIWLNDPAQADPCDAEPFRQRYALAVLYYSTDGTNWSNSSSWLSGDTACSWYGVTCDESNQLMTGVNLENNSLAGSIPSELEALTHIQNIDLSDNSLESELPDIFSFFGALTSLDVERNLLQGDPFLDVVQASSTLKMLKLSSNFFTGTISSSISQLSNLEELWLASNGFTSEIPSEIGALTSLLTFYAYDNRFGKKIPSEIGLLTSLLELQLFRNALTGPIPEELYNDEKLTLLRLDVNNLSGSISSLIGNLVGLQDLWLSNNTLQSRVPATIGRLTNLENLLLNSNRLTGTLRDGFDPLTNLKYVDFSSNLLTGNIPSSLFEIQSLSYLYFTNNELSGSIPINYGDASSLIDLYLNSNRLSGQIPPIQPGQLPRLNEFLVEDNSRLSGSMPVSICNLRTAGNLDDLWADCAGSPPAVECSVPNCCTACF